VQCAICNLQWAMGDGGKGMRERGWGMMIDECGGRGKGMGDKEWGERGKRMGERRRAKGM